MQMGQSCRKSIANHVRNEILDDTLTEKRAEKRKKKSFLAYAAQKYMIYVNIYKFIYFGTSYWNYLFLDIPDGPGYQEKFYFSPGDTGFKVWYTKHANIGIGICWDQWFPEAAR